MKKLSKVLVLVLSAFMVLAMSASVFAATVTKTENFGTGEAKITVSLPENRSADNTYKIYKVFDATTKGDNISYTLNKNHTDVPAGFAKDTAGNVTYAGEEGATALTDADIEAIKGYVTDDDLVATVVAAKDDTSFEVTGLEYGYYYITTTTGSLVTVDSTKPNASVADKNALSVVKKSAGTEYDENAKKAIAAVGTDQEFTAQITVGKGTTKLEFSDTMTNMEYNNDVEITIDKGTITADNYTVTPAADKKSFTVVFKPEYVKNIEDGAKITLQYSAKVTSDALTTDPANNKAELKTDNNNTTSDEVEVYNATLTVKKVDGEKQPLPGAGFTLYKKGADGKYAVEREEITGAEMTEFVFKGLGAGDYKIEESTVPAGYNKADDVEFTISASDFEEENLVVEKTIENQAGAVLPSTGGIGTTIFYILGTLLVVGCGIVLVSRKRMENHN